MKNEFLGWEAVAEILKKYAIDQRKLSGKVGEKSCRLNFGQRASLMAIAERITENGVILADEVGMGKTRIAVELVRAVVESGGRVAILVPPGLGYQWGDELKDGKMDSQLILRSLWQYLAAWESETKEKWQPWFDKQVVVTSHAFTNWRLSKDSEAWRWALLPEFYAQWRQKTRGRFPRDYYEHKEKRQPAHGIDKDDKKKKLSDPWVNNAAENICDAILMDKHHVAWRKLADELSQETPWPGALEATKYGRNENLRPWLERVVGLGLGVFDFVVVDEAHKSRGTDSGLSRLIDHVVLQSEDVRRFAMTATPVELNVDQWPQTLARIGVDQNSRGRILSHVETYAAAVKRIRQCPSSREMRNAYKEASAAYHSVLFPYLLRRDKREDPAVQLFKKNSNLPSDDYRRETEITVETAGLSDMWKQAICAAEALSVVTRNADNSTIKRLRLTVGNGHGVAAWLDQIKRDEEEDRKQEQYDEEAQNSNNSDEDVDPDSDSKREGRIQWWLDVMKQPFSNGEDALFDHPAILAAVDAIEGTTGQGEKVLVFGRFTRPLRALVNLLNAREMLRCLQDDLPWPQTKVYGDPNSGDPTNSDWPAVRAAHRQLRCEIPVIEIDERLEAQYSKLEKRREILRRDLIAKVEECVGREADAVQFNERVIRLFSAFKKSVESASDAPDESSPLALIGRALLELVGNREEPRPYDLAVAFVDLLNALADRDEADPNGDGELDEEDALDLWSTLEQRLREEYARPQGGFARLMYGGTKPASRRMIQLAFNRPNSFPRVLVAQSLVGREGLNLHKACRIVMLLHPEWNPGIVEQQIGRVDRVGSHWAMQLEKAIKGQCRANDLPRIEVRPVIFKGTYDEYNWTILHERWDALRAQFHGIIIPDSFAGVDPNTITEISKAAPNFSPSRCYE